MLTEVTRAYSTVFAPELFIPACALLLVGYEWRRGPIRSVRGLGARLGVLAIGWVAGLAVYRGVPHVVGTLPKWQSDALGSVGLVIGLGVIWGCWRLFDWGGAVFPFAGLLVAVSVPHLLITPFWDVSSHVLYTVVPAGVLAWLDRRFLALAVIPLGMVAARPLAGVHTWPQSVGGLALGVATVLAFVSVTPVDPPGTVDAARTAPADANSPGNR